MVRKVLVLGGDGIGPEVTRQGVRVLSLMAGRHGLDLSLEEGLIGGASIEVHGEPLSEATLAAAKEADAVLFGAAGDPKYDHEDFYRQPGKGLLKLRRELKLFANLRPVKVFPGAEDASPLKPERIAGADLLIVRELIGGIYFGEPRGQREEDGKKFALNTMIYSEEEVERIVRFAFKLARGRVGAGRGRLTSVDKGNALEVGRFWRETATRIGSEFPEIPLNHLYVDNAAMQIIRDPRQFDTLVMGNMFGDILSDAAANLAGSLGMLPSASIGERHALYEPCHGSAPDIAGTDLANPIASVLSVGMMLHHTFGLPESEEAIHFAVDAVLRTHRTTEMMAEGKKRVGCAEMGDLIVRQLEEAV